MITINKTEHGKAYLQYHIQEGGKIIQFMHEGNSSYTAKHYFSRRDNFDYDASMLCQWFKKKDELLNARALKKRLLGGGRKPLLADLEEILG